MSHSTTEGREAATTPRRGREVDDKKQKNRVRRAPFPHVAGGSIPRVGVLVGGGHEGCDVSRLRLAGYGPLVAHHRGVLRGERGALRRNRDASVLADLHHTELGHLAFRGGARHDTHTHVHTGLQNGFYQLLIGVSQPVPREGGKGAKKLRVDAEACVGLASIFSAPFESTDQRRVRGWKIQARRKLSG